MRKKLKIPWIRSILLAVSHNFTLLYTYKYFPTYAKFPLLKGPLQSWEIKQVSTLEFYFYILFKTTFHDFLRSTLYTLISDPHKNFQHFPLRIDGEKWKYRKTDFRFNVYRISHFSPSIRNEKCWKFLWGSEINA